MKFRPFYFREKDDGGGGTPGSMPPSSGPATPPATPPTSGGTPESEKDGKAPGGDEIKLTPTAFKERLDRAEKSAQSALAKSLGFETVEAMQTAVAEGQKALREKMSEQERIQADLEKANKEKQEANERAIKAETSATQARLQAEALALMAGKFANPKAALKLVDLSAINLADPKFPGLAEAIEKLASDEPWTLIQNGNKRTVPNLGPTNPQNSGKPPEKTDDDRRRQYFGGGVGETGFFRGGGVVGTSGNAQRIGG